MQPLSIFHKYLHASDDKLDFNLQRCLRSRLRNSGCSICLEACHSDALQEVNGKIRFNSSECSNCLRCLAVCPNEAFSYPGYDLLQLVQSISRDEEVIFNCVRQSSFTETEMVVPCHAIFPKEFHLALYSTNAARIIFNILGCSGCENHQASLLFQQDLLDVKEHIEPHFHTQLLFHDSTPSKEHSSRSRRAYLTNLVQGAISLVNPHQGKRKVAENDIKVSERRVTQRLLLLNLLLEHSKGALRRILISQYTYHIEIDSSCRLCPLCKGICPTGAIKLHRKDGEKSITTDEMRCSGCNLCVEFCKDGAISVHAPSNID